MIYIDAVKGAIVAYEKGDISLRDLLIVMAQYIDHHKEVL